MLTAALTDNKGTLNHKSGNFSSSEERNSPVMKNEQRTGLTRSIAALWSGSSSSLQRKNNGCEIVEIRANFFFFNYKSVGTHDVQPSTCHHKSYVSFHSTTFSIKQWAILWTGFPGGSVLRNLLANAGDVGLIPGSGRSPREGNGNPIPVFLPGESHGQRSLECYNSMGLRKSRTQLRALNNNILKPHLLSSNL